MVELLALQLTQVCHNRDFRSKGESQRAVELRTISPYSSKPKETTPEWQNGLVLHLRPAEASLRPEDTVRRRYIVVLLRTMTSAMMKQGGFEVEALDRLRIAESSIYFNQTRCDCEKSRQD